MPANRSLKILAPMMTSPTTRPRYSATGRPSTSAVVVMIMGFSSGVLRSETIVRNVAQGKRTNGRTSPALDEAVEHFFRPGLLEIDGELVALDGGDGAVAEFQVKHPLAQSIGRGRTGGAGDQFAVDGQGSGTLA